MRSGTGVVEELLARKMCVCAAELHTLCTAAASAAEATDEVALLARALSPPELKELHILLDTTGHEALTDFINLQVYGTLNMDVHTALERSKRASAALTAEKAQPKGQGKGRFKTAMASLQKAGKASVLLAMASARRHSGTGLSPPFIDGQLRFASVLPDDHPLAQVGGQAFNAWRECARMRSVHSATSAQRCFAAA